MSFSSSMTAFRPTLEERERGNFKVLINLISCRFRDRSHRKICASILNDNQRDNKNSSA